MLAGCLVTAFLTAPLSSFASDSLLLPSDTLRAHHLFAEDPEVQQVELSDLSSWAASEIVFVVKRDGKLTRESYWVQAGMNRLLSSSLRTGCTLTAPKGREWAVAQWMGDRIISKQLRWRGKSLQVLDGADSLSNVPFYNLRGLSTISSADVLDGLYYPRDKSDGHTILTPTAHVPDRPFQIRVSALYMVLSASLSLPFRSEISYTHAPLGIVDFNVVTARIAPIRTRHFEVAGGVVGFSLRDFWLYRALSDLFGEEGKIDHRYRYSPFAVVTARQDRFAASLGGLRIPWGDMYTWISVERRLGTHVKLLGEGIAVMTPDAKIMNFTILPGLRFFDRYIYLEAALLQPAIPLLRVGLTL